VAPATVVIDYFAAINAQNWTLAWALGGDNLYSSLTALVADYVGVTHEDVTVLSRSGDTVVADVRTTRLIGTAVTRAQAFVVQHGVIVSRGPAPAG
jgi:hypothetical protein